MKKNTSAASDEEIIAALISFPTVKEAAKSLNISTKTIYNRLNDGEVMAAYQSAKADILRGAVMSFSRKLESALNVVAEIMEDQKANPAVRLQAAQTIINNAPRYFEKLAASEEKITARMNPDLFGTLLKI